MFSLRDYQTESIQAIKDLSLGSIGLIVLPTGAGKTIVMAELARQTEGRILIVVPSGELREQTIEKLKLFVDESVTIGSVQQRLNEVNAKIVVATRQSLTHKKSTRLDDLKEYGEFEIIIFDEVHEAVGQVKKVLEKLDINKSKILGMTATPWNKAILEVFDKITYKKNILWMIENKYLVEPLSYEIETKTDISNVGMIAGEFNQKEMEIAVNNEERNNLVVQAFKEYAADRKHCIAFCSGIQHARDLAEEFNNNGIVAESLDSRLNAEERATIIERFKSGEIQVITNFGILTRGFDFRPVDCILFCSAIGSRIKFVQCLGRGLRLSEETGKENCLVLDFKDIAKKHNIIDLDTIFKTNFKNGETLKQAKERKEKEDIEEQLEQERLRKEEIRKQEELIAKEIDLLNSNLDSTFSDTYYDWFKINNDMFALSQSCDLHYAIYKQNKEFICYKVVTKKNETDCEELETFENVTEAINYIENSKLENAYGGYAYRNTRWKNDSATENQLKYVKSYYAHKIHTKWDVHRYFKAWLIQKLVENK